MPATRRVGSAAIGATRRRWIRPVIALVMLLLVLSALRSPQAVLAWLDRGAGGPPVDPADQRAATPTGAAAVDPATTQPPFPPARTGLDDQRGLQVQEVRGDWRIAAGSEEAAALAILAANAWARDLVATAPLGSQAGAARGPATIALEAVERPGPSAAIVTVLIDLDGDLGAARRAAGTDLGVLRLAFPIDLSAGVAAIAGPPWRLADPGLQPKVLQTRPVTDARLIASARRALDSVGLDGEAMVGLDSTDGWAFIARLHDTDSRVMGRAPTGDPWLRWHLDRFVVTGVPLQRAVGGND
jgi:hypothetical protein